MKRILSLSIVFIMAFSASLFAAPKKVGVVVAINPAGMALVTSNGKTSAIKAYTEIRGGDVIEVKQQGKIEIILTNFEKVILKNRGKVRINDDLSVVNIDKGQNNIAGKKKDKFSDDIARDMSTDNSFTAGASRGADEITDKVRSEIAEAEKIEDEFLKHTAMYHIYRKYSCKEAMAREAKTLSDMQKGK